MRGKTGKRCRRHIDNPPESIKGAKGKKVVICVMEDGGREGGVNVEKTILKSDFHK